MSAWRFGDWDELGLAKPLEIIDRLIFIFSGQYESITRVEDRPNAELVFAFWETEMREDLKQVLEDLPAHRAKVVSDIALGPRAPRTAKRKVIAEPALVPVQADVIHADLVASAPDLSPPFFVDNVARHETLRTILARAPHHAGIVIEGWPRSGKRYLARQFVSAMPGTARILWVDLAGYQDFAGLLGALAGCRPPLEVPIDREVPAILDWLRVTGAVLTVVGLNDTNIPTFRPLLQALSRRPGPCRVILTSTVATDGPNVVEIGRLSAVEAAEILKLSGAEFDVDEIRSLAREIDLSPHALRQTIVRFGAFDRDQLTASIEDLHDGIVEMLPESLRAVYEVLELLNADIDLEIVAELLDALGVDYKPAQVIDDLERYLLAKRISGRRWRLETAGVESLVRHVGENQLAEVLVRLARFYYEKAARGGRIPSRPGYQDCLHLFAACRLLQLADHDPPQRKWLTNRFASQLEHQGEHARLLPLCEYEMRNSDDPWDLFRYVRILFVVGDWGNALDGIDRLFHLLLEWQQRDGLYLSVIRLLAELLIELDQPDLAARILDVAIERADVSELTARIFTATASVLSWALLRSGHPDWCIALNEQILDRNFKGLADPFSKHISLIRTGVARRVLGDVSTSVSSLRQTCAFFAHKDVRAYAWSSGQLALSLDAAGDDEEAARSLRSTLDVNASHDLANGEALALCQHFAGRALDQRTQVALDAETERLELFESNWRDLRERIAQSRLIEHVLIDLDIDLSLPFTFDILKYELISFASPHAISSVFTQSLIRNLREADLEEVVDELFRTNPPERIFNQHLFNRVIVEACKGNVILTKKFIVPYFDTIVAQTDSTLLFYARCLEAEREIALAEQVLARVRRKNFSYYSVTANCAAHSNPTRALQLNDEALRLAETSQRRAQILVNKARIIYDRDMDHRFGEARKWCEESIRAASNPRFHWPCNLLLKIALVHCPLNEVEERIIAHRQRYPIPVPALVRLLGELRPGPIRAEALRVANELS